MTNRPEFWGYDTGARTIYVECSCGKHLTTQLGYEQHMKAKHPDRVRRMKKLGRWQQDRLDGWAVQKSSDSRAKD